MDNKISQIVNFMGIVEKLCLVNRDNKMSSGRLENDSDHVIKLCYLVMMVSPYLKIKVDYTKMLELALVHDLVEAISGDYSLSSQAKNPKLKEQKKQAERAAMEHYKTLLPVELADKIEALFEEYEQKSSREAKIVWVLDKLEANLQANQYNEGDVRYWAECDNGSFYYKNAVMKKAEIVAIDEEIISELEDAIIEISKRNMQKCKISV